MRSTVVLSLGMMVVLALFAEAPAQGGLPALEERVEALEDEVDRLGDEVTALEAAVKGLSQSQMAVIDANGHQVGEVVGVGPGQSDVDNMGESPGLGAWVALTANEALVVVHVSRLGMSGTIHGGVQLFFETDNCTASDPAAVPYFQDTSQINPHTLLPEVVVVGPTATAYRPDKASEQLSVSVGSWMQGWGQCEVTPRRVISAFRAVAVADLLTIFTPPFSVVLGTGQ